MNFLKNFGHNVVPIFGGLIPFNIYDADSIKKVQGITLKNVNVSLIIEEEKVLEEFGEILFTHFGISGPTVLRISSKLYNLVSKKYKIKGEDLRKTNKLKDKLDELFKERKIVISIDLKPGLELEKVKRRIERDFEENVNKEIKSVIRGLMPESFGEVFLQKLGIDETKKINNITKEERNMIITGLKDFRIELLLYRDIKEAIITHRRN